MESLEPKHTHIYIYTLFVVSEDRGWFGFLSLLPQLPGRYYPSGSELGTLRVLGAE